MGDAFLDTGAGRPRGVGIVRPTGFPPWLLPGALGLAFGAVLCLAPSVPPKVGVVLVVAIVGCGLLPIVAYFRHAVEETALFALALTLPLSLKFHPVFRPDHIGGAIGLRVSVTDLLLVLIVLTVLLRMSGRGTIRIEVDTAILASFATYWLLAAVSTVAAVDRQLGLFELVACIQAFATFAFLTSYLTTRRRLVLFLGGALAVLCLQSVVTVYQARHPDWQAPRFLGAPEEQKVEIVGDQVALPEVDLGTTFVQGEVQTRPAGLLIHPNVLAFYLILGTTTALGVFLVAETAWLSALSFTSLALAGLALYFSLSRSGWAGTAFAVLLAGALGIRVLPALGPRRRLLLAAMVVLACGAVAMKADRIYSRITDTAEEAIEFRENLGRIALRMIAARPLTGVGLNGFAEASDPYDPSGEQRIKRFPVHDVYLLEASEVGLPGGLAFLTMVVFMVAGTLRAASRCRPRGRLLPLLLASGIAGFWFAQLSDFVYRIPILTTILWAQVALAFASARVMAREERL